MTKERINDLNNGRIEIILSEKQRKSTKKCTEPQKPVHQQKMYNVHIIEVSECEAEKIFKK